MKKTISNFISNLDLEFDRVEKVGLIVIVISAFVGLYCGWRLFWFLTDDAYIAFRYVSNSILGYGYVWNPPPFRPVEGYTSFLWVFILDIVWRVLGIVPPKVANWISFLFSSFTLALGIIMCLKIEWGSSLKKSRLIFLFLFLLAILSNPTFLIWTSSGLETAMFNFLFLFWIFSNFYLNPPSRTWLWSTSISTTLLYLARPDGILAFIATIFMIMLALYRKSVEDKIYLRDYIAVSVLGLVPLHLFWRLRTYGQWLPNTYFAKSSPSFFWVKSGALYFLSFVIEYSLWLYLGLIIFFVFRMIIHGAIKRFRIRPLSLSFSKLAKGISLSVLLGHFLYYTFVIGGDYFEYRVYSHLILLIFFSTIWFLNKLDSKPMPAVLFYVVFLMASWVIPWTHWSLTQKLTTLDETQKLRVSVSEAIHKNFPLTPGIVLSYLDSYDSLQSWLSNHYICIRYQEHKTLWQFLIGYYPSREMGSVIKNDDFPVVKQTAVGVISWVLPHVNVIDMLGLNDYVIARNPDIDSKMRMAHFRRPPKGYVNCFEPNVKIRTQRAFVVPRIEPLTENKIIYCENHYLQVVENAEPIK